MWCETIGPVYYVQKKCRNHRLSCKQDVFCLFAANKTANEKWEMSAYLSLEDLGNVFFRIILNQFCQLILETEASVTLQQQML